MRIALWILQVLLAALFIFGGVVKLMMPVDELVAQVAVPGVLLQFISVMEILGGLGLVLPGLLRIGQQLTPLAAAGLTVIMAGAVVFGVRAGDPVGIGMPLVIGLLTAFVANARWRRAAVERSANVTPDALAPLRDAEPAMQSAQLRSADQNV